VKISRLIGAACLITILDLQGPALGIADELDAAGALAKLRSYFQNCETAELTLEARLYAESAAGRRLVERERVNVAVDQRRHRIHVLKHPLDIPDRAADAISLTEQLVSRERYLQISADPKTSKAVAVSSVMEVSVKDWNRIVGRSFFGALVGYMPLKAEETSLVGLMQSLPLSSEMRDIDGLPMRVLAGQSSKLSIEIWLDPAAQFMPRRIVLDTADPTVAPYPHYAYEVNQLRVESAIPFPSSVTISVARSDGSNSETLLRELEVVSAALNGPIGDAKFAIHFPIPNSTRISMEDAPQLGFVWQDGKIIPNSGTGAIKFAEQAQFTPPPPDSGRHFWLILNAVIAIVVLVAIIYRHRMASR